MSLTPKAALALIGGLSDPTKMPGRGYSIPARDCITGAKLRQQEGTVCSGCYALGGHYAFPTVQAALERRRDSLVDPSWVEAMAVAIRHSEQSGYFRWHDSGDLQSVDHLANIVKVCHLTPDVSHYLPTREYAIVKAWYTLGGKRADGSYRRQLPDNLVVRLSVHMIDGNPNGLLEWARRLDPQLKVSVVTAEPQHLNTTGVFPCQASKWGNQCRSCRACWRTNQEVVGYPLHKPRFMIKAKEEVMV